MKAGLVALSFNGLHFCPAVDRLIAAYQRTRLSARKIEPFIRKYKIDMSQFEPGPFESYTAFFERRLLPGERDVILADKNVVVEADGSIQGS
jgi:phosphatidylserine decarboxylase